MCLKKVIIIFSLIAIHVDARIVKSPNLTKHVNYFQQHFVFNYTVGENTTFTYALCEPTYDSPKIKCVVTLEVETRYGDVYTKSCSTYLSPKRGYEIGARKYSLVHFGQQNVIFAWKQAEWRKRKGKYPGKALTYFREFIKVRVIDMKTCRHRQINITTEDTDDYPKVLGRIENISIVPYNNDTFHIFYRNQEECGTERRCSVEYSFKDRAFKVPGTIESLPIPYDVQSEVLPIMTSNSTLKAYVLNILHKEDGVINLINPEGEVLYHHKFSWSPFEIPIRIFNLAISNAHGNLGICQQGASNTYLDCSLFDYNGKATLGISVSLKLKNVTTTRMLNTEDGGFLVMIGYARNRTQQAFDDLDILKINSQGWIDEVSEKGRVECDLSYSTIDVNFIARSGFQHCYYVACYRTDVDGNNGNVFHLKLSSECYPIDEEARDSYYYSK